jgi:plasmid stabilization system protein ParE
MTSAGDWYESEEPGLGLEFAAELSRALEVVAENPLAWPLWPGTPPTRNIRRFFLTRFPFSIACMVQSDRVVVLAVAHQRRHPNYWFDRMKEGG